MAFMNNVIYDFMRLKNRNLVLSLIFCYICKVVKEGIF
jgi:hypothetical protein